MKMSPLEARAGQAAVIKTLIGGRQAEKVAPRASSGTRHWRVMILSDPLWP